MNILEKLLREECKEMLLLVAYARKQLKSLDEEDEKLEKLPTGSYAYDFISKSNERVGQQRKECLSFLSWAGEKIDEEAHMLAMRREGAAGAEAEILRMSIRDYQATVDRLFYHPMPEDEETEA